MDIIIQNASSSGQELDDSDEISMEYLNLASFKMKSEKKERFSNNINTLKVNTKKSSNNALLTRRELLRQKCKGNIKNSFCSLIEHFKPEHKQ